MSAIHNINCVINLKIFINMYKVIFNSVEIANFEKEQEAIGLSLNLHNISNIPHNIFVSKDDENLITFIQR